MLSLESWDKRGSQDRAVAWHLLGKSELPLLWCRSGLGAQKYVGKEGDRNTSEKFSVGNSPTVCMVDTKDSFSPCGGCCDPHSYSLKTMLVVSESIILMEQGTFSLFIGENEGTSRGQQLSW